MSRLWEHETERKIEYLTLEREALAGEYERIGQQLATKEAELKRLNWVIESYKASQLKGETVKP